MELDDWQQEALSHKGNLLLCTGRQIGKTMILARKCSEAMVNRPGVQIVICSLSEDQAKIIIFKIQDYLIKYHKKLTGKIKKADKWTQNKASTNNGSTAVARPVGQTGDSIRGFTSDILVLDEVSRFNELIMTAATPVLFSTGGEIWAASTPHGKKGWFWDTFDTCYNKGGDRFKVIYKSSEEVAYNRPISKEWTELNRKYTIEFLEREKAEKPLLVYSQEYLGLFSDDIMQFFPDELIEKCCTQIKGQMQVGNRYLGVDLARLGGDDNSYQVVSEHEDKYYHLENITHKGKLTPQTERDVIQIATQWRIKRIGIDAGSGSLGVSIYDHIRETEWRNKIIPLNNRVMFYDDENKDKLRMAKEDYYNNLKAMMEHGTIRLLDDPQVRLSLKSVQGVWTMKNDEPSKFMIFSNPHDDSHIIEGLVRAAWVAKKEKVLNLYAY